MFEPSDCTRKHLQSRSRQHLCRRTKVHDRKGSHSLNGDRTYTWCCVEDENAVWHIPIGWCDKHDVTHHYLSLLTTPTKCNEYPTWPSMIGHKHQPPGLTDNNEGPLMSTEPTTRIDKWPWGLVFESLVRSSYFVPRGSNQDQDWLALIPKPKIT